VQKTALKVCKPLQIKELNFQIREDRLAAGAVGGTFREAGGSCVTSVGQGMEETVTNP
jgi:hypothetical protein